MHFEHYSQPILAFDRWLYRVVQSLWLAAGVVAVALMIGVAGYHFLGDLAWIDAFLEASMILGGMGAIAPMTTDDVKIFAACYALFSGLVVLSTMGILLAPWLHRMMHYFYTDRRRINRGGERRRSSDR